MRLRLALLAILLLPITSNTQAEMVSDSNTAYFAGERFDIVLAAPRGFKLITTEAQADGYACAIIPQSEEYESTSQMLGVNFFKIRGMSFDRALTQDTANLRSLFGSNFSLKAGDPLAFLTGDSLRVFQLTGLSRPMNADFFGYLDAGTDILIIEASRTSEKTAADAERLLRSTTALARVLTRAELDSKSTGSSSGSSSGTNSGNR